MTLKTGWRTSPTGDDGREPHGDVQRVRTGAEHDDLRHGGVVTVTAGAAPAWTVTKSATPAVLVVAGSESTRSRSSVAEWADDAAINVSDGVLPQGHDQRSDHGDGRDPEWLSGQWGDESGGLHGSVKPVARW